MCQLLGEDERVITQAQYVASLSRALLAFQGGGSLLRHGVEGRHRLLVLAEGRQALDKTLGHLLHGSPRVLEMQHTQKKLKSDKCSYIFFDHPRIRCLKRFNSRDSDADLIPSGHVMSHVLEAAHHPLVPKIIWERFRPLGQQLDQFRCHLAETDLKKNVAGSV